MRGPCRIGALFVLLVSACGTDTDELQAARAFQSTGQALVRQDRPVPPVAGSGNPLGLTRAALDAAGVPVDLLVVEAWGAVALIGPTGSNAGVETWASADDRSIARRDGIVVATRGFGADLIAAEVPTAARIATGSGQHARTHVTLDGEDRTVRTALVCTLAARGVERVVIVQRAYALRRVAETCRGGDAEFTNDYWFEGGRLRQSRQWVGPWVGHLGISRLSE